MTNIVIQCHDNPDADAIACGYAGLSVFTEIQRKRTIVWFTEGRNVIRKTNLVMLIRDLEIPIAACGLQSAQTGAYCSWWTASTVPEMPQSLRHRTYCSDRPSPDQHGICRSFPRCEANLGACSTLIWQYAEKQKDFDVTA